MIRVGVFNTHGSIKIRTSGTSQVVKFVLKRESNKGAELNVVFVDDPDMLDLNRKYLRHDYPTDVLSFHLGMKKNILEGEIYINIDQARRQAGEYRSTYRDEYARLIIHGLLHLVGYDDSTRTGKSEMTTMENNYIAKIKENKIKLV